MDCVDSSWRLSCGDGLLVALCIASQMTLWTMLDQSASKEMMLNQGTLHKGCSTGKGAHRLQFVPDSTGPDK